MRRAVVLDGNYAVYEDGTVTRIIEVPVKVHENGGYLAMCHNKQSYMVHRLIAEAFVENPDAKPQVNHKDGNKKNNAASNLEWVTQRENTIHAYANNLISRDRRRNKCDGAYIKAMRKSIGMTQTELAKVAGLNRVTIAKYETTDNGMTVDSAQRIATALGCTVDELLGKDSA